MVVAISSLTSFGFALFRYADGEIERALLGGFSPIAFAGAILVFRWTGRFDWTAHYLSALFTLGVVTSPMIGSESAPLLVAMLGVPLAAVCMGGIRVGLVWTGIVTALLAAAAIWLPFDSADRAIARSLVMIAGGTGVTLAITDFARERAMRLARSSRERVDDLRQRERRAERDLFDSQAVFATAFNGAPSALVLSVTETREVLDVNESFVQSLGFTREEMLGRTLMDVGVLTRPQGPEAWQEQADGTFELKDLEILLYKRSGEPVWFLTSAKQIEIGGRLCTLSQGIDITERKRTEQKLERRREELELRFEERGQQLKASQEQLRESERLAAVGTLAAGIAHQINNPIGGIIAAAEFALAESEDADGHGVRRKALETSLEEARRCGRIVKSVLKFSRDEPTPKWVENLNSTVRRAAELTRSYVEERGGQLEVEMSPEELPVMISPIDIEQVVLNLVRNAAESRSESALVRVATVRNGDQAEMIVTDNGYGIQEPERARLFDPFYTTRLEDGGSGLGLSVVHGVVGDHGGKVEVESRSGGGTRFRIAFPIVVRADVQVAQEGE